MANCQRCGRETPHRCERCGASTCTECVWSSARLAQGEGTQYWLCERCATVVETFRRFALSIIDATKNAIYGIERAALQGGVNPDTSDATPGVSWACKCDVCREVIPVVGASMRTNWQSLNASWICPACRSRLEAVRAAAVAAGVASKSHAEAAAYCEMAGQTGQCRQETGLSGAESPGKTG